ncbi:MAG: hypothetical protein ACRDY7_09845 [Acidimicrobiia bacterium]
MRGSRAVAVAVTVLLALGGGCGGGDDDDDGQAAAPATPGGPGEVPEASMRDVSTGEELELASLVPAERPILFWFWAPH